MTTYAVRRVPGPRWDATRGLRHQDAWEEHAAFMDRLAVEGFVRLGGPLGDGQEILLVVESESEADVRARLAEDPWVPLGLLHVASIEAWTIVLGEWG